MPEEALRPKKSKKKIRRLIWLVLPLLLVVGVILFMRHLSDPAVASIKSTEKTIKDSLYYSVDLTPVWQSGNYASFDRPKGMSLYSSSLNDPATSLESYNYYVKDVYSWTLAIDVTNSTDGLKGLSAYAIRINDPATYGLTEQTINNQKVSVFSDNSFTSGFSKVAFFSHGSEVATVSLIGNDSSGTAPLVKTFNMVISTWAWR